MRQVAKVLAFPSVVHSVVIGVFKRRDRQRMIEQILHVVVARKRQVVCAAQIDQLAPIRRKKRCRRIAIRRITTRGASRYQRRAAAQPVINKNVTGVIAVIRHQVGRPASKRYVTTIRADLRIIRSCVAREETAAGTRHHRHVRRQPIQQIDVRRSINVTHPGSRSVQGIDHKPSIITDRRSSHCPCA